jgi:serine protease Do
MVATAVGGTPALAQPDAGRAPSGAREIALTFAPLVDRAKPAVVNIFTRKFVPRERTSQFLEEPIVRWLFGGRKLRLGAGETVGSSLGSGVIVQADGLIVTSHHVIAGARDIAVVLSDRRPYPARLVLGDPQTDLAVLKIETGEEMPFLEFADSDEVRVGDFVVAIGNPFGVGQSVTTGVVSALARTAVGISDFDFFIQTDAAINPGNSGGALIDVRGRLVGVNTAIYTRFGGSVGIGYAIPTSMVRAVVKAAIAGRPLVRPWIGATGRPVPVELAAMLGFARPHGALVVNVHPGGPFAAAGGQAGDIVVAADGREIEDGEALRFRVATRDIGSTLRLHVRRGWLGGEIDVVPAAPLEDPPAEERRLRGYQPLSGARVASLSPALAERIAVDSAVPGVVVLDIARGSAAGRSGLRPRDVIVAIDGTPIATVADLAPFIRRPYPGWKVAVRRGAELALVAMSMVRP